jgi:hypothetical protein
MCGAMVTQIDALDEMQLLQVQEPIRGREPMLVELGDVSPL